MRDARKNPCDTSDEKLNQGPEATRNSNVRQLFERGSVLQDHEGILGRELHLSSPTSSHQFGLGTHFEMLPRDLQLSGSSNPLFAALAVRRGC